MYGIFITALPIHLKGPGNPQIYNIAAALRVQDLAPLFNGHITC